MSTELTKEQLIEILLDTETTKEKDIELFQVIHSLEGHKAYAGQLGRLLGYNGKNTSAPLNSQIGRYARRIEKKYNIPLTHPSYPCVDLFFEGWSEGKFFSWQLKQNLIKALEETELTGDIEDASEIPVALVGKVLEGSKRQITVNVYERNSIARKRCIEAHGTKCLVCEIDFYEEYGEIGKDFIHVHHLIPIHTIGKEYKIDPIKDLVPICPNCHAMIHREKKMLEIDELKQRYKNA